MQLARTLYHVIKNLRPTTALEVGMAFGASSLSILTAMDETGSGRLLSIDPAQMTDWHGVGVESVRRAGLAHRHELVAQADYLALPRLLEQGLQIDFAYIDGWHTFDYVLLDFFYLDKMLRRDGIVAFNDCGWRAVHRALGFVQSHRKYKELDVGLPKDFRSEKMLGTLLRRLQGRTSNDRYFLKLASWEPGFDFYEKF
jgi:predicted O-methyltransferase YrrM